MVIVEIIGGLGNQLFQYALGRRLSLMRNVPLLLDISSFQKEYFNLRSYKLSDFNVSADFATPEILEAYTGGGKVRKFFCKAVGCLNPYGQKIVRDRFFRFDPNILALEHDVYLSGYWQSEKYFRDIESTIRADLRIITEPTQANKALADEIKSVNAVSIHVRRADYVDHADTQKIHGVCSLEYYSAAVEYVASRTTTPVFYLFSDDPDWTRKNIVIDYPSKVIEHNGADNAFEDLRLMSLCRHNIIANSTFSWWGAWLNGSHDKIVVGPRKWFNTDARDSRDVLPDQWIKL